MTEKLLRISGVSKSFPGVRALSKMHLDLNGGEVLALVGENGAGKSTLMKLLSGIYTPDEGGFEISGRAELISDTKRAKELGIGIIHQEFNLMPDLTVAQNIFIGTEPRRAGLFLSERALNRQAQELFDRIKIDLDPRQPVRELTVAKQQMVEIAKALAGESKILIMDEPTAALNDAEVAVLHGLIRDFVQPGTGVIYISHRMEELKAISDRITVIRDGEYIDTLNTAQTSVPEVIALMVGRQIAVEQRPQTTPVAAETVLKVSGLCTRARGSAGQGSKNFLQDVDFELHRGEILGFAGLMGAGRTEVARAIVGADKMAAGTIELHGRPVSIANPAAAAALGIGYLSEDRKHLGLMLERDVKDNIVLSSLKKFSRAGFLGNGGMKQASESYVQKLRIKTPSIDQAVKNLSGGNQQKVVIAKWLVRDCEILIFDEPTRGIDVGAKEEIYALLNQLAADGKSIIMISSELPEVLRLSHRIAVMAEGRIAGFLDNEQANQENIMELATRTLEPQGSAKGTR
ncbi:sugar ABC transporter ATP-binding protein [Arthrobacter russicus]|uniref:Ribose transport system ATP-binding protein n=1 Tax=Arthrobacter russicus TaxID=172040 RepID=A0ABU1JES4_9MICC|nr:sugar ABC transporter ATP-binding protein [Arthrobacter russicus]MBQ1445017.1 sugar ABC transporter ATP-binding protein [Renibacterium sp.]MDR6269897.1 ribose transport system ATP-binding protein [Arthrobacter russicus]